MQFRQKQGSQNDSVANFNRLLIGAIAPSSGLLCRSGLRRRESGRHLDPPLSLKSEVIAHVVQRAYVLVVELFLVGKIELSINFMFMGARLDWTLVQSPTAVQRYNIAGNVENWSAPSLPLIPVRP